MGIFQFLKFQSRLFDFLIQATTNFVRVGCILQHGNFLVSEILVQPFQFFDLGYHKFCESWLYIIGWELRRKKYIKVIVVAICFNCFNFFSAEIFPFSVLNYL
eukprot:TRINITY_DN7808_c0_g1_i8.p1 TRINITY_DN7808_c0_g1~~TRINITY_DN7808_c0_g1_i8.p1  ORF type:complete len:103 (-),score=3.55 TRINITY_DN7808_c0_g1_i8:98-406(-)